MKKSKVVSTLAITLFAFTMINCSNKQDNRNRRNLKPANTKAAINCRINSNNPVGAFHVQAQNIKELEAENTMKSQIDEHVIVEVVTSLIVNDEGNILLNGNEFRSDREKTQFIKNFLPNGLIKTYALDENIASIPEKNCEVRSIYEGDTVSINNVPMRVVEANPQWISSIGSKVIETKINEVNTSLSSVTNSVDTSMQIAMGNTLLEGADKRNKSLQITELNSVISKDAIAQVTVKKEILIVPKSELENIKTTLKGNSLSLVLSTQAEQTAELESTKDSKEESAEQKTLVDDAKAVLNILKSKLKATKEFLGSDNMSTLALNYAHSVTNMGFNTVSLSELITLDKVIDNRANQTLKSVEALNLENNKPQTPEETPSVEEKQPEDEKENVEAKENSTDKDGSKEKASTEAKA